MKLSAQRSSNRAKLYVRLHRLRLESGMADLQLPKLLKQQLREPRNCTQYTHQNPQAGCSHPARREQTRGAWQR
jgi:hypothetical protein